MNRVRPAAAPATAPIVAEEPVSANPPGWLIADVAPQMTVADQEPHGKAGGAGTLLERPTVAIALGLVGKETNGAATAVRKPIDRLAQAFPTAHTPRFLPAAQKAPP